MNSGIWKKLFTLVVLCVTPVLFGADATSPSTQPAATQPARPPLGVNLEFVNDYARSMVFVDAMKSARKFGSPRRALG